MYGVFIMDDHVYLRNHEDDMCIMLLLAEQYYIKFILFQRYRLAS